jgi:hypothetical protein
LLAELVDMADEATRKRPGWPKQPHVLSGQLKRLAVNLRALGVVVVFHERNSKGRLLTITKVQKSVTSGMERHDARMHTRNTGEHDAPEHRNDALVTLNPSSDMTLVTHDDTHDALLQNMSDPRREVAEL